MMVHLCDGAGDGAGYVTILIFVNFPFCYTFRFLDRMFREKYLDKLRLQHDNDKLLKRLNAIDLMKQGKLVRCGFCVVLYVRIWMKI